MLTWLLLSSIFLWIIVLLNLILTLALVRRVMKSSEPESGPPLKQKIPAFTALTLDGETVTPANYLGRAMTFLFVAAHCEPCHSLLKTLSAQARADDAGLVLILNGSRDEAETLAHDLDLHMPLIVAPREENTFFETYSVAATPTYCNFDAQGVVRGKGIPGPGDANWQRLVESWSQQGALAGRR